MRIKILILVAIFSAILNGTLLYKAKTGSEIKKQKNYPFVSKRVFIENKNDTIINFTPLRKALREYTEDQDTKIGIYFEYLSSGVSIGINDKDEIKIASLSKVPTAMAILKQIENGKLKLKDTIIVEDKHLNQEFGTLWKSGAGAKMSVEELLYLMLTESDNTAYNVLVDQITAKDHIDVYESLDITLEEEEEEGDVYLLISPKNYSSILRSLYLSSYNTVANSNYILDVLTKTSFNNKIGAGVPKEIRVAHKVGVFEKKNSQKRLFSDCGIIYVPNRPYILCMFTQETDEHAQVHMSNVSKIIYEYIKITGASI